MNKKMVLGFLVLCSFFSQTHGMLSWFWGKSDAQIEKEKKEKERTEVLTELKTVDLKQAEKTAFPKKYEEFLQTGPGSSVGESLEFLWDGVRKSPDDMKREIGIPLLSGVMVNGMLEHQSYVKRVFQESSQESVCFCPRNRSSLIGRKLSEVLEAVEQKQRKLFIQKTTLICATKLFATVSDNKAVMAKRFTRNTKVPGLKSAVESVLGCVANDHERWSNAFARMTSVVFAKQLLSESDLQKLKEESA